MPTPEQSLLSDIQKLREACHKKRGFGGDVNELSTLLSYLIKAHDSYRRHEDMEQAIAFLWNENVGGDNTSPLNCKALALKMREQSSPILHRLKEDLLASCPAKNKKALSQYLEERLVAAGCVAIADTPVEVAAITSEKYSSGGRAVVPLPLTMEELKAETHGDLGRLFRRLRHATPTHSGISSYLGLHEIAVDWNDQGLSDQSIGRTVFYNLEEGKDCPRFLNRRTKATVMRFLNGIFELDKKPLEGLSAYMDECAEALITRHLTTMGTGTPLPASMAELREEIDGDFGRLLRRLRLATPSPHDARLSLGMPTFVKHWKKAAPPNYVLKEDAFYNVENQGICPRFLNEESKPLFLGFLKEMFQSQIDSREGLEGYLSECLDGLIERGKLREDAANVRRAIPYVAYISKLEQLTHEQRVERTEQHKNDAAVRAKILRGGGSIQDLRKAGLLQEIPFGECDRTSIQRKGKVVEEVVSRPPADF